MQIDESSFTGEMDPRHKHVNSLAADGGSSDHIDNVVYMGTLVRSGHGKVFLIVFPGMLVQAAFTYHIALSNFFGKCFAFYINKLLTGYRDRYRFTHAFRGSFQNDASRGGMLQPT